MKRAFFILLVLFYTTEISSQTLPYAKEVVQTLSSEEFKGRGYVEKGDKIAAKFIADEFKKFGLKPYSKDYFQKFNLSINTFPNPIELEINGHHLKAGYDYLVTPGSPSISGTFDVVHVSVQDILSDEKLGTKLRASLNKFIVIENIESFELDENETKRFSEVVQFLKYHPNNPASGTIELTSEKLTWNGSQSQHPKPSFTLIEDSLKTPISSIKVKLKSKLQSKYSTQNVLGYIEGTHSDSLIVLIAHYDHFGKMGTALFPGANDNASGMAMMLSLAKYYSEHTPKYTTAFIAFGGEELGLLGSKYFVEHPLFELSSIKFLLNFDLAGTGDEGIQVVNGSVYRKQFDELSSINEERHLLPQIKIRGKACNSDHCFFDEAGVPSFYIYTLGGIRAYHDVYDVYETLPFTEFEDYFSLITEFLKGM